MPISQPSSFWKTPQASKRAKFRLAASFSPAQGERMLQGVEPTDMDDRWLVRFEHGWLIFYRSWSGAGIFGLELEVLPEGVRVVDGWVSRDEEYYQSPGIEREKDILSALISSLFSE